MDENKTEKPVYNDLLGKELKSKVKLFVYQSEGRYVTMSQFVRAAVNEKLATESK